MQVTTLLRPLRIRMLSPSIPGLGYFSCSIRYDLLYIMDIDFIPRPKRLLEQIKGISEQKATKILVEGE